MLGGDTTYYLFAHGPLYSRLVVRRGVLRKQVCDGLGIAQYDMPGAKAGRYLVNRSIRPFPILVNETNVG